MKCQQAQIKTTLGKCPDGRNKPSVFYLKDVNIKISMDNRFTYFKAAQNCITIILLCHLLLFYKIAEHTETGNRGAVGFDLQRSLAGISARVLRLCAMCHYYSALNCMYTRMV